MRLKPGTQPFHYALDFKRRERTLARPHLQGAILGDGDPDADARRRGAHFGYSKIFRDTTDGKRAEELLQQADEFWHRRLTNSRTHYSTGGVPQTLGFREA
jgi:hypothetical protein